MELLKEYHIPVWVMEPVRGGALARLPEQETAALAAMRPDTGVPAWAFRFLQSIPEVTMVLSGMSDMEQLRDNIRTFSSEAPLTEEEWDALQDLAREMIRRNSVPCTACRYCMEKCPQGLPIPALLGMYNSFSLTGANCIPIPAMGGFPEDKWPTACVGCRSCEAVCPQNIAISEVMCDFASRMK